MDLQNLGTAFHYAALAISALWFVHASRKSGLRMRTAGLAAIAGVAGALVGGALLAGLMDASIQAATSGMVSWGAYLGGSLAAATVVVLFREPLLGYADVGGSAFALGLVTSRIGCWIAGCCFGKVTWGPTGMGFGPGTIVYEDQLAHGLIESGAPETLPVYPFQLSMVAVGLALFALPWVLRRSALGRTPGLIAGTVLMLYGAARFFLEHLRGDTLLDADVGLGSIGSAATALLGACLLVYAKMVSLPAVPMATGEREAKSTSRSVRSRVRRGN